MCVEEGRRIEQLKLMTIYYSAVLLRHATIYHIVEKTRNQKPRRIDQVLASSVLFLPLEGACLFYNLRNDDIKIS